MGRAVHHSDRGSLHLPIKYTERLAEVEIDLCVAIDGDAHDNAVADCVIGLLKTEVINQIGHSKSMRKAERETLDGSIGARSAAVAAQVAASHPQKQRAPSLQP